jgi:hypothetical protein
MNNTLHIPGPWKISHEDNAHAILSKGFVIADVFHEEEEGKTTGPNTTEEAQANARLISAAPELLAICEEIANDSKCDLVYSERRIRLYSVIAKAKGEA